MNETASSNSTDEQDSSMQLQIRQFMESTANYKIAGVPIQYDIPRGFPPDKLGLTPCSTPFFRLLNATLVAMSVNKKWIAYVTNQPSGNMKTLNIIKLTRPNEDTTGSTSPIEQARIDLTRTYPMLDKTKENKNGGYFLSISSQGDRVVLSSMYAGTKKDRPLEEGPSIAENEIRDIERARTGQDSLCLVFKVSKNMLVDVDKRIIQERRFSNFQGRAVFLEDDSLALISSKVITIYDPNDGYRKKYWMDLTALKSHLHFNNFYSKALFLNPGWAYPVYYVLRKNIVDEYLNILYMTQHITQGFLTTYFNGVVRVWSVKGAGVQLMSLADEDQEIIGISPDEKFMAKMSKKSEFLGIYHTKTGLLVNRLTQRRKTGIAFDSQQAHYAYFCSKHQFLLWISFKEIDECNQIYISFELWNVPSEILISYQEVVAPMIQKPEWKIEPWVVEQQSSFVPKFRIYYSTYEGSGAIVLRSITLDTNTPRPITAPLLQQQKNSGATKIGRSNNDSNNLQTVGDTNFPEGSGSAEKLRVGDIKNISWCLKSLVSKRVVDHSFYEHYQVENALCDYSGLTCYEMKYQGIKYLLRLGTHTVQLWRLSTQYSEEQLIYIRAFKPAYQPFTQDYDYKWIRNIQPGHPKSEEDLRAFARTLQPNEHGRIEISVCSEKDVDGPDYSTNSYIDEVYLPLKELVQSETYLQEKEAEMLTMKEQMSERSKEKLPANARNYGSNNKSNGESFGQTSCDFKFKCVQYHYIESACQALHYLCIYPKTKDLKQNKGIVEDLVRKTIRIVETTIREMQKENSNYFTTISGSSTIAMLASFDIGREILFDILATDSLPISLFSYIRRNAKTEQLNERIIRKENALTVLIERLEYDLYHLLFNRLILHSTKVGIGSFSALTDTLVFLQNRGAQEVLGKSLKQLSFLEVDRYALPVLNTTAKEKMYMHALHKNLATDFRDLVSHSSLEQIIRYDNAGLGKLISHTFYWWSTYIKLDTFLTEDQHKRWSEGFKRFKVATYAMFLGKDKNEVNRNLFRTCVVPLLYFCTYDLPSEDQDNGVKMKVYQGCKVASTFLELALGQHENDLFHQWDTVLEVLLQYKWETFVQKRFFLVYSIHIIYYVTYSLGVLFAVEAFNYTIGTSIYGNHLACIILMFISGAILLYQEIRQFLKSESQLSYFASLYNHFDMAVIVLPVVTFWQMRFNKPGLYELESIATICFWIHGILRLRAIAFIGITLETIINLVKSVYKLLFIMLLVIVGFTNAFIVLLSRKDDSYFQEKFSGATNQSQSLEFNDISSTNSFGNPLKAFSILWFCIYGVWDPLKDGDAGDDYMVMILAILFSFVTIVLFFNLIIALMSSKAEELKGLGKNIWISHFAAVIAEIEQLWCTPFERHWRRNNPSIILYVAKQVDIENQRKNMKSLLESIIQELKEKRVWDRGALWNYNQYPTIYDQMNIDARNDIYDQDAAYRRYKQELKIFESSHLAVL